MINPVPVIIYTKVQSTKTFFTAHWHSYFLRNAVIKGYWHVLTIKFIF